MKKIFAILLFAGMAFAADVSTSSVVTYNNAANGLSPTAAPNTLAVGIPLNEKNKPMQYVNVTVQPVWDGGQGFQITGAVVRAWKSAPQATCVFDGGTACIQNFDAGFAFAWARYPVLDFAWATDSGTPYVTSGPGGVAFSGGPLAGGSYGLAPTYNNSRLYYTIETLTAADAGTLAIGKIILEGVY